MPNHHPLDWLRNNRFPVSIVVLFSAALAGLYFVSIKWLFELWLTDRAYSHGFLIPLIAIYLVWLKRDILPNITIRPAHIPGALFILLSLLLLLIGRIGAFAQVEAISLLLILPSLVLFILGWDYLKALALPLFYLQFMVPWMDPIIDRIHMPFQLISATLGTFFLGLFGYPVFHDKVYIHLPNISLEVAKECSGISFLITVIAIGLALVYLTQKTWTRAALVLISGVFIVVLSNGIRVALAGMMGQCYGPEMLHGPAHIFHGWFVAQVGLVGIFLVNWGVTKIKSPIETRLFERGGTALPTETVTRVPPPVSRRPLLILLAAMVLFSGYLNFLATPNAIAPRTPLPYRLGNWYGQDDHWLDAESYFPGALQIVRTYRNSEGLEVKVFIPFLGAQSVDSRLISYHSRSLYNDGDASETGLARPVRVKHAIAEIDHEKYETLFWFRLPSGDYIASSEVKIKTIQDALVKHQNYGAFILLATPTSAAGNSTGISKDLQEFLRAITPKLNEYLP